MFGHDLDDLCIALGVVFLMGYGLHNHFDLNFASFLPKVDQAIVEMAD